MDKKECPYLETKCEDITCPCPKYFAYKDAQDPEKVKQILEENHFDTSLSDWELMYSMQRSFASRLHKIDNLTKEEMDHWIDKYLVCIEDELREVREYLDIYSNEHHNASNSSQQELKKEVIDILHFMMDLFICGGATPNDISQSYVNNYLDENVKQYSQFDSTFLADIKNTKDLIALAYKIQALDLFEYLNIYSTDRQDWSILKAACKLSDAGAQVRQQISWKHWKKPNNEINKEKLFNAFALVFHEFINLCMLVMQEDEIKNIYIKKNVENIQRQFYGY